MVTNNNSNGHGQLSHSETTTKHVSDWKKFFHGFKLPHPSGKPDKMLPLVFRIAYLLDWVAKKAPYNFVPYNVVYKEANALDATPRSSNEDVARLRTKLSSCRPILQKLYKRDLKNLSGIGVRATVDDLDVVKTTTRTAVRRFNSAGEALKKNAALVNPNKLPEGADKSWFTRTVSPAVKALTTDDRMLKLLPPAPAPKAKPESSESK